MKDLKPKENASTLDDSTTGNDSLPSFYRQLFFIETSTSTKARCTSVLVKALAQDAGNIKILLLTNDREFAKKALENNAVVSTGQDATQGGDLVQLSAMTFAQARSHLGLEYDWVFYDIYSGINPNLLLLSLGWIRGEGGFIVLGPPLDLWDYFADPEAQKLYSIAEALPIRSSLFTRRLVRFLAAFAISHHQLKLKLQALRSVKLDDESFIMNASLAEGRKQQAETVANVMKSLKKRSGIVVTLSGLRGRGKSTALGQVLNGLLAQGKRCLLSAPSKSSVYQVLAQVSETEQGNWSFQPLHKILEELPNADVLLIDEAAALPVYQVQQCVDRYKKVILTTTTEGYEGTGAGFARKVVPYIQQHHHCVFYYLDRPLRWCLGDRLERWSRELFAHRDDVTEVNKPATGKKLRHFDSQTASHINVSLPKFTRQRPAFQRFTQEEERHKKDLSNTATNLDSARLSQVLLAQENLYHNEVLLNDIFSLLAEAHYQTSPNDLRYILDAPKLRIYAQYLDDLLVGVCLICEEGPWQADVINRVLAGQRRFKGDFFPQTWVIATDFPELSTQLAWRIMRIAIRPEYERHGFARRLVAHIEKKAKEAGVAYTGATFGLTTGLFRFWSKLGYQPVLLGTKADHVSGELALVCVKPVRAVPRFRQAFKAFQARLLFTLSRHHQNLDPYLTLMLLKQAQTYAKGRDLSARERFALVGFVEGGRSWLSVSQNTETLILASLCNLEQANTMKPISKTNETQSALAFLIAFASQGWTVSELSRYFGLKGYKEVQKMLRSSIKTLLNTL